MPRYLTKLAKKIKFILITIIVAGLVIMSAPTQANELLDLVGVDDEFNIPVITDADGIILPDWARITFDILPIVEDAGSINIPQNLIRQLGYDPNRVWEAGTAVADILLLGDLNGFDLEERTIDGLEQFFGVGFDDFPLEEFDLIQNLSVGGLIDAYLETGLDFFQVDDIPLLQEILGEGFAGFDLSTLRLEESIANLLLEDFDLAGFTISDIQDLRNLPIREFENWQQSVISRIPGLSQIPFSEFQSLRNITQIIGIVDIVFSDAEQFAEQSISGSDREGFNVPCADGTCGHIELSGTPFILGKRWISGDSQQVEGGKGILRIVNGGMEATGRLPFPDAPFKMTIRDLSETEGSARFYWEFRACFRDFFGVEHCTPYALFRIPIYRLRETEWHYLGLS